MNHSIVNMMSALISSATGDCERHEYKSRCLYVDFFCVIVWRQKLLYDFFVQDAHTYTHLEEVHSVNFIFENKHEMIINTCSNGLMND